MKFSKKIVAVLMGCLVAGLFAAGCTPGYEEGKERPREVKGKVIIGSKAFTEQLILSKITSLYLREQGYDTEEVSGMSSGVARAALEKGQIDLYWEYTGTGLLVHNGQEKEMGQESTFAKVKSLDEEKGLVWLERADFSNTYTILMRADDAQAKGIKNLSDLAAYVNSRPKDLVFGSNAEFYVREDGMRGIEKAYGFSFPKSNVVKFDTGLTYVYLKERVVDVAMGFATDGRVPAYALVALEDDLNYFPTYDAAPVVRRDKLRVYPELESLLGQISAKLNNNEITKLNYSVDVEHEEPVVVARKWLVEKGLIP